MERLELYEIKPKICKIGVLTLDMVSDTEADEVPGCDPGSIGFKSRRTPQDSVLVINMIDTKNKPPYPHRPPAKAMTIAASFQFDEGVLLCADRLITHGTSNELGSFGSYQEKIWDLTCEGFSLVMTGAGTVAALAAIADKTMESLRSEQAYGDGVYQLPVGMVEVAFQDAIDEVYESIDPQTDNADMILAVDEYVSGMTVVHNMGHIVSKVGTSEVVGIGENSLIGFFRDTLYSPRMTEQEITVFAALLVHAAKTYCPQYCGGATDIKILRRRNRRVISVPIETVDHLEAFFRQRTKDYIRDLLDGAIQSLR
jgi:hypothetical protein